MTGPEVVQYAIAELSVANLASRNSNLNKIRYAQIEQLTASVAKVTSSTDLEVWEQQNKNIRHLAISLLDSLKPGWNRKPLS